jgi:hypothetical protein
MVARGQELLRIQVRDESILGNTGRCRPRCSEGPRVCTFRNEAAGLGGVLICGMPAGYGSVLGGLEGAAHVCSDIRPMSTALSHFEHWTVAMLLGLYG